MITLSNILLDLRAAHHQLDLRRRVLHKVERERKENGGKRDRIVEGRLAMAERRVALLHEQRLAILAAVDKLAGEITMLACAGLDHEAPHMQTLERRALDLLGCEPLDAGRWPYASAALRAREWPEDPETIVAYYVARQVIESGERRAA